jgi:hypothetical protein
VKIFDKGKRNSLCLETTQIGLWSLLKLKGNNSPDLFGNLLH